jgi:hypothetical protein
MSEPASPRNLQKLVEEIKTNGFEGVKCPFCDTTNLKLKARIDGDADNRRIERSVVCKNCNHVYIHKL